MPNPSPLALLALLVEANDTSLDEHEARGAWLTGQYERLRQIALAHGIPDTLPDYSILGALYGIAQVKRLEAKMAVIAARTPLELSLNEQLAMHDAEEANK